MQAQTAVNGAIKANQNNAIATTTDTSTSVATAAVVSQLPPIEILGAVKVKNGLFLGDEFASQVTKNFIYY